MRNIMNGTYQHRMFFIYFDLFTIKDDGICVNEQFFPWCEISSFSDYKERAYLKVGNKTKIIQTRCFRKKGEPLTLSFLGKNSTYENFRSFIYSKIRENNLGPEYKRLRNQHDDLVKKIEETKNETELLSLARDYKVCLSQLNNIEKRHNQKLRNKTQKIKLQLFLVLSIVVGTFIWALVA